MSLNLIVENSSIKKLAALQRALEEAFVEVKASITEEEKHIAETKVLNLFEDFVEIELELKKVSRFENPDFQEIFDYYNSVKNSLEVYKQELIFLIRRFISYVNSQLVLEHQVKNQIRRVKQKLAALKKQRGNEFEFSLVESFLSLEDIESSSLIVRTNEGIATLPVLGERLLSVQRVKIGSGSNGSPGALETPGDLTVRDLTVTLNVNPNSWFEYERFDSGPLLLEVVYEFSSEEVINFIEMEVLNSGGTPRIVDIEVISSKGIKKLNEIYFKEPVFNASGEVEISLLPTLVKEIRIKFEQNNSTSVELFNSLNQTVRRKRFAILLKRVMFKQIRYKAEGEFISVEKSIPTGLHLAYPVLSVYPNNDFLYTLVPNGIVGKGFEGSNPWLLDEVSQAQYGLKVFRNGENFVNSTSFNKVTKTKVNSLSRLVDSSNSPFRITLPKLVSGGLRVIQPKIARRGSEFEQLVFSKTKSTEAAIKLPFSPLDFNVDPEDISLYRNRRKLTYVEDNLSLAVNQWSFSDDFTQIETGGFSEKNEELSLVFKPEKCNFVQSEEGFVHLMELPFDADKNQIQISYLGNLESYLEIIPRDQKIIKLSEKNILPTSLVLDSKDGLIYVEVNTKGELVDNLTYWVDYKNGIMRFGAPIGNDTVRVSYQARTLTVYKDEDYELFWSEEKPIGINIKASNFFADETVDVVGQPPQAKVNVETGLMETRVDLFSSTAKVLTHERIIKGTLKVSNDFLSQEPIEVDFIDGRTEFLGIIPMLNEVTPGLASTGSVVTFNLSVGALVDLDFRVLFGSAVFFSSEKTAAGLCVAFGDYHVSSAGLVTVFTGSLDLPRGISIKYYYRNPNFIPDNKYSVNYKRGIIYSYSPMVTSAKIRYKYSTHFVSYDIVGTLPFTYDKTTNSVEVVLSNLLQVNNQIKIYWTELQGESLEAYRDFFSPYILEYTLGFY